jgi:hypothetical protein
MHQAIMPAHGFTLETVGRLVLDGLATVTSRVMHAGGRPITVTWLMITDLGRQALGRQPFRCDSSPIGQRRMRNSRIEFKVGMKADRVPLPAFF